jgi:hypothetical protein
MRSSPQTLLPDPVPIVTMPAGGQFGSGPYGTREQRDQWIEAARSDRGSRRVRSAAETPGLNRNGGEAGDRKTLFKAVLASPKCR